MKGFIKNELSLIQQRTISGGRRVEKIDLNGDGKWNVKIVYRNDGTIKRYRYRYT